MMNTKKIAVLSLLVISSVGQVSADPTPYKIESSVVINVLKGLVTKQDAFNKSGKSDTDDAKVLTACQNITKHYSKDNKDVNELDLGNGIKTKKENISINDNDLNLIYAYVGRNGGGSGSSSGWGWTIGAGVIGLVIGGAGAYFVLSGDSNGGSDE